MRNQKGVLLVVVMMIAIALGLFGNSEVWADSYCGVCKKVVSWTQISDCPDCGGYRSTCDSCGGCYHTCSGGGTSGGGTTTSEPRVVSITAVDNANSVTLKATVKNAPTYLWSRGSSISGRSVYENGTGTGTLEEVIVTATVSKAGLWYINVAKSDYTSDSKFIEVCSIEYNANNGSNAPATQYEAKTYNLTLTSSIPTRAGYTFLGWSENSNATTARYEAGDSFQVISNTTLYAVWKKRSIIPIDTATVTLSPSQYTYDGTEHMPAVNVVVEGKVLIPGTEYTFSYSNNKNAGTATVTITGVGNYTGTVTKTFEIKKKELTLNWSLKNQFIYNGTQRTPTATVASVIENESITLSITPNPAGSIEAGSYVATATIVSVTNGLAANYTITNPTKAYEILDPSHDKEAPVATVEVVPVYMDSENNRYVDKRAVTLKIRASDNITETQNLKIALLNESDRISAKNEDLVWEPFTETKSWQLSEGKGKKRIYIYVKDEAGNQSAYLD